jgi:hypothetical protein
MINFSKVLANSHYFWLTLASLMVILPLILFGEPGYYGDDFHMIQGLNKWGVFGSINSWVSDYGWSYRPVGISFMYLFYYLLYSHPFLIYLIYQVVYLGIGWLLYEQTFQITSQKWLSIFVAVFFMLFPFNPTAYWQLSSVNMVVVTLFTLVVSSQLIIKSKSNQYLHLSILSLCWLILLFSYEQIAGLILVIILIIWIRELNIGIYLASKKTLMKTLLLILVTLLFLLSYFATSQNAKIASLTRINVEYQASEDISENIQSIENSGIVQFISSGTRIKSTLIRLSKVSKYIASNFIYAISNLADSGFKGIILSLLLIYFASMILLVDFVPSSKIISITIMGVGILWFVVTLAPFFLYPQANIPVYTLMLPSIGIGFAVYGFFSGIYHLINRAFFSYTVRLILFIAAFSFPLLQYGYYFGLKEELSYWENVAEKIENYKVDLLMGSSLVLHNIDDKNNNHIFWLEKAIANRHLRDSLDPALPGIKTDRQTDQIIITLKRNDKYNESTKMIHINNNLN